MKINQLPSKHQLSYRIMTYMIVLSLLCMVYILASFFLVPNTKTMQLFTYSNVLSSPTSLEHIVFGIASNKNAWKSRKDYVRIWWRPQQMRGCVFLDTLPPNATLDQAAAGSLPPVCLSEDTSRNGLRSAIRVTRVVSETVSLNYTNVRWFVFGDDDTVFFPENLVKTLSKYDHGLWYYIGTNSESVVQNKLHSFGMAFGGAGFAISYSLAKVLANVLDSCLDRYPPLYGSDERIQACLAELGVSLTHEPGFHQMDFRGSMFGFLASHPLRPLVSLHHLEEIDPIFPNMTRIEAIEHLFQATSIDSLRVVQQSVCYDRWYSWTVSVSWGYAVQVFPRHMLLVDALRTKESYMPWRKGGGIDALYGIDTSKYEGDPCKRAAVFFFHSMSSGAGGRIRSTYRAMTKDNCTFDKAVSPRKLEEIRVVSQRQQIDEKQLQSPRRQCCDVLGGGGDVMELGLRECGDEELIYMH